MTDSKKRAEPTVAYCPYCGSGNLVKRYTPPRCGDCRAVFFITFGRFARRSPVKSGGGV